MKIHIPKLGELLTLSEDWTFSLHAEDRNLSLMKVIEGREISWWDLRGSYRDHYKTPDWVQAYPVPFMIPKGTILSVDRIYIRKGAEAFDSVTFRIKESSRSEIVKARFWAPLDDVNNMEIQ